MLTDAAEVDRLWKTSRFLPQSVRLLGTRYRALFLAHARQCDPTGPDPAVADALAFLEFMAGQERLALLAPEQRALKADGRPLRRKFRLKRDGRAIAAIERWRILQWLPF